MTTIKRIIWWKEILPIFIFVTFLLSFNIPSAGGSVYLRWWAALDQGVILLAGTSQDGPLLSGSPEV